jgi:Xaa-Pro aminopeptidase
MLSMTLLDDAIRSAGADAFVAYGSSADAGVRYLTRFRTEDPVVFIKKAGENGVLIVSQMEYERAARESPADVMTRADSGLLDILKEEPVTERAYAKMIVRHAGNSIIVPMSFPFGIARELERLCSVSVERGCIERMRSVKSDAETDRIRNAQKAADAAMKKAISLIRASRPDKGILWYRNRPLTSETVRAAMHKSLMDFGCSATDTIVSCGEESAMPHAIGSGPLRESESIVLDIFPRDDASGYYADMTRTVVRGEPVPELREMYEAVLEAQDLGMRLLRHAVPGSEVHQAVVDYFRERGYGTGTEGFTHNLGHGVGLDVHELPTIGPAGGPVAQGNTVTVEPGLYYRRYGGVRLENTGAVTMEGFTSFTRHPREFILE